MPLSTKMKWIMRTSWRSIHEVHVIYVQNPLTAASAHRMLNHFFHKLFFSHFFGLLCVCVSTAWYAPKHLTCEQSTDTFDFHDENRTKLICRNFRTRIISLSGTNKIEHYAHMSMCVPNRFYCAIWAFERLNAECRILAAHRHTHTYIPAQGDNCLHPFTVASTHAIINMCDKMRKSFFSNFAFVLLLRFSSFVLCRSSPSRPSLTLFVSLETMLV